MEPNILTALLLCCIGAFLLVHHLKKHYNDEESSAAKTEGFKYFFYFQLKDISNHETWVVVCLTNALSIGFLGPALAG